MMNILRTIRKWVTQSKATELSGIDFNKEENVLQVKVVFVGNALTGKSNLVWTLSRKSPWVETPTPQTMYGSNADVRTPQGVALLSLWDACVDDGLGGRLKLLAYTKTGIIALVFSVDDPGSLEDLEERWKEEVEYFCPGIPKVVIGCKSDLRAKGSACVDTQTGIDVAKRIRARHYIECSAQRYIGIEELLERVGSMAWEIYEHSKTKQPPPASPELLVIVPKGYAQSEVPVF
ncbi:hypothetical protein FRC12_006466 [Ceratobasidium sp. 428]|nr:hypothetical protein FRC12_006466 [Ceratobasidium sp. 428]